MALESRQGFLLGSGQHGHALGTLAKVAGRQGAAPPGGSAAAEEREEGASVESLAGKVPDLPWEAWTGAVLGVQSSVKTEPSPGSWGLGCVLIWGGTNLLQSTWRSLKQKDWFNPWVLKIIPPVRNGGQGHLTLVAGWVLPRMP